MKMKVSDFVAEFLSKNGIKDVFAITGGGAIHLDDSIGQHPNLNVIFHHHEQACAMAAEGYAKYSGDMPAVCVTSGPGGTNAITGVLCAWLDSIPMFVISGQVKTSTTVWSTDLNLRQLGDQEFDIASSVANMTKYSVMITEENEILYHLEKALYLAKNGRPGPVWLDIPLDIQAAIIDTTKLKSFYTKEKSKPYGDCTKEMIDDVLEKVRKAKRPVIIVGTGIRIGNAYQEFLSMIEKLEIPVVTAWNAHDLLWDDHALYCGRPGTVGTRGGNFVVQNSDLLISLGCRLNIRQISYNWESFAKNAFKIMVDIDKAELFKPTLKIDMPIHADVKEFINLVNQTEYTPVIEHSEWLAWCKRVNEKYPAVVSSYLMKSSPVNPYVFIDRMSKCFNEDEIIVTSNGSACVVSFQASIIKKGQRLFTNSGCASMGYGLPAAIGVAIHSPTKRVICIEGDGSIQMNIQELQTVVHHNMDMKIIWLNNNGYLSIRQTQNNLFNKNLIGVDKDSGISFPEAEKIANAYGIKYFKISDTNDIEDTMKKAMNYKGPVICEVILDIEQNFEPKLSSKILDDGTIVSPEIDDMYPFLDREEYLSNKIE